MPQLLDLAGLRLAVSADTATRTDGGVLLPDGPVAVLHPFGPEAEFYRHGWNSWSPSGWARLSGRTIGIRGNPDRLLTADDIVNDTPHAHSGSGVGAVAGPDGTVLLLGALGLGTPRVGADRSTLWGTAEAAGGGWFLAHGPEDEVFAAYRRQLVQRFGARAARAGRVWSSWYSYYEAIDEDLVARTAAELAGEPFDVLQLDDGWEPVVGDWVAGPDFASGMRVTADRIHDAGFRAGLWLAPLIALPTSEIALTRPDLLVRDQHGAPLVTGYNWGTGYHSLDTTLPEVADHLAAVLRRVVDWGYTYLKLDFMYAGAVAGHRSVDLPREQAYREAVQHIRAVVGDDVYLLGSGVPMLPSIGVFDGVRVGPDIAPYWDPKNGPDDPSDVSARTVLDASVNRAWLQGLYQLDPDAVYFRSERNLLDPAQRQLLRDLAAVLDFRSTSDPVSWLRPDEREALRRWFTEESDVRRVGRMRWLVDGRLVDFGRALGTAASQYPVSTVVA